MVINNMKDLTNDEEVLNSALYQTQKQHTNDKAKGKDLSIYFCVSYVKIKFEKDDHCQIFLWQR